MLRRDKRPGRKGEAADFYIRTQQGTAKRQAVLNARRFLGPTATLVGVTATAQSGATILASGVTGSDAWAVLSLTASAMVTYTVTGTDQGQPVSAPVKVMFEVVA